MRLIIALAVLAMTSSPAFAAAPCKNANGKFIKCAPPAAAAAPAAKSAVAAKAATKATGRAQAPTKRCHTAKGQFAKCGTPGAM